MRFTDTFWPVKGGRAVAWEAIHEECVVFKRTLQTTDTPTKKT